MENLETKVCPHCAETIKVAAKVCPHCRFWQRKWSLQNPQVSLTLYILIVFGFMLGAGAIFDSIFGQKEEFVTYRNEIAVTHSEFSQRISQSNLWNTIVGTLTNYSKVSWKDVGIEAQFFDKSGKMIDAIPVSEYNFNQPIILPHGEAAFKIEGKAARPSTEYWTNKLNVRWAKDVHALF